MFSGYARFSRAVNQTMFVVSVIAIGLFSVGILTAWLGLDRCLMKRSCVQIAFGKCSLTF